MLEPHQRENIVNAFAAAVKAFAAAVKAFAARTSGPDVKKALESALRDQWIIAMADEIHENMINGTKTLVLEDIDKTKVYKLIHTTMQLKIKMKTDTIVDKLKARLCACGNELEEVENETYSPTVSSITHAFMLQIAVHDRMHIQMILTKEAYLCQQYPEDATPLYIMLPKRVAIALNLDPDQTYRVKRYMYGLPEAGRAYYDAYSEHLRPSSTNVSTSSDRNQHARSFLSDRTTLNRTRVLPTIGRVIPISWEC